MKKQILGYLELNTNLENPYIDVQKVYDDLDPEVYQEFESCLIELHESNDIRILFIDCSIKLCLNTTIDDVLGERKSEALDEMKTELQSCIDEEKYEEAREYQDMIDEYETKGNDHNKND